MKVLFLDLFPSIWGHSLLISQLKKLTEEIGHDTETVICSPRFFDFCSAMEAKNLLPSDSIEKRDTICFACKNKSNQLLSDSDIKWEISSHLTSKQIVEIDSYLDSLNYSDPAEITFEEIDIGKFALYETLIRFKKSDSFLTSHELVHFKGLLRSCVKVVLAAKAIIPQARPDKLIVFSPQYGLNNSFSQVALNLGIPVIFMEGSANISERLSSVRLWDWETHGLLQPALGEMDTFSRYSPGKADLRRVNKMINKISRGNHYSVYSTKAKNEDLREKFQIPPTSKIILLSMSSYDEVYSGYIIGAFPRSKFESKVFSSQITWVQETIRWVSNQPDIHLIVRPHPREYQTKVNSHVSEHFLETKRILSNLPKNVTVDLPEYKTSVYDLFELVDVVSTGWSFTGIEALLAGVPVVSYDKAITSFPEVIHLSGNSRSEYFENLKMALNSNGGRKLEYQAKRWLCFISVRGTIRLGGRLEDRFPILRSPIIHRVLQSKYLVQYKNRIFCSIEVKIPPRKLDILRYSEYLSRNITNLFQTHS